TAGVSQTTLSNNAAGDPLRGTATTKAGASSTTNSWTWTVSSQQWASSAAAIKPFTSAATNFATFTQTPAFYQNFVLPAGSTINITNFVTVATGSLPANPA